MAKIWIVMGSDYDESWIIAAYDSESVAMDHVERAGKGYVTETDLSSALPAELAAIDLDALRAERERAGAAARATYEAKREQERRELAWLESLTIQETSGGRLCHCETFTADTYFVTPHGYCRYCGGWRHQQFRQHYGEQALREAINLLAHHERVKMRHIAGLPDGSAPDR